MHRGQETVTSNRVGGLARRRDLLLAASALPAMNSRAWAQGEATTESGKARMLAENGPSADQIRALLTGQIEEGRDSLGYVCGIEDTGGPRLISVGQSDAGDGRPFDGDSVFEIGSITKVFTALLLADMTRRGEVALTDPVAKYLPPEGRPRAFDGKDITLLDLATYTSGLPRMPGNFRPADRENPYADYSVAQLHEFVSTFAPLYYPGSHYEYANLGFGLLGHALTLRAGRSYEDLVVSRICAPLGLNDTRITLTPDMRRRLVPGHDTTLQKVANWDLPTLAGAGALRSTANDLMRFLEACQGRRQTSLSGAFASLLDVRRPADGAGLYVASGWFVQTAHGDELVWKDGDTGGYATFIGYSARTRVAALLLSNSAGWYSTPRLGRHLLNAEFPVPAIHREVTIDPAKLVGLAGRYPLTPSFVLTVTPRNGRLMVQATGQREIQVYPESDTQYFYRVVDAQLTFKLRPDGSAEGVVLHQNGRDRRAARLP
jgi:D-alanyl-D-alanine-carboxypeptidase/D-alanyl-D-alanine-endopeptidase